MINYMDKMNLSGKIAAVCGGLGLLGKQISIAFAQAGAKVIIMDINKEVGSAFEAECGKNSLEVKFEYFDSTAFDEYSKRLREIDSAHGPIEIFVNAAYPRTVDWGNHLPEVKTDSWQKNIDMHLNSYCLLTRDFAELMKRKSLKGSIINISSIYGVVGPDFEVYAGTEMTMPAAYAAIKGGIISFSRYAAAYYGKEGIRVNVVCPGGVFDNQNETFVKNYGIRTPLRRMAKKDEIVSPVLFLASEGASYITGAVLMVDGGWTCI